MCPCGRSVYHRHCRPPDGCCFGALALRTELSLWCTLAGRCSLPDSPARDTLAAHSVVDKLLCWPSLVAGMQSTLREVQHVCVCVLCCTRALNPGRAAALSCSSRTMASQQ